MKVRSCPNLSPLTEKVSFRMRIRKCSCKRPSEGAGLVTMSPLTVLTDCIQKPTQCCIQVMEEVLFIKK